MQLLLLLLKTQVCTFLFPELLQLLLFVYACGSEPLLLVLQILRLYGIVRGVRGIRVIMVARIAGVIRGVMVWCSLREHVFWGTRMVRALKLLSVL